MLQPGKRVMWGCPIGNGQGTQGYTFHREENQGIALDKAGYLCQASAGKGGKGCVLFVTVGPMPWMEGKTTI